MHMHAHTHTGRHRSSTRKLGDFESRVCFLVQHGRSTFWTLFSHILLFGFSDVLCSLWFYMFYMNNNDDDVVETSEEGSGHRYRLAANTMSLLIFKIPA